MIKTLILDDKQHSINQILYHLKPYNNEITVVASCKTIEEAIKIINSEDIDLAFLDVEIGNKTSFDFLNQLNSIDFKIIFVTGFNKYALEAFECAAIHFLLKPIIRFKFQEAIKRFFNTSEEANQRKQQLEILKNRWGRKPKETITIPSNDKGLQFVKIKDIVYIKAAGSYCEIIALNGVKYLPSKNLFHYEKHLKDTSIVRIHKSHMVNINYITNYIYGNGGSVILDKRLTNKKISLSVAKEKKQELLKLLSSR